MIGGLERQKHRGYLVHVNTLTEQLRNSECLCLSCVGMTDCSIARTFYDVCVDRHVALMVTRCREFKREDKDD
jgi:hypothetical protein